MSCSLCQTVPSVRVRERRIGSKGFNKTSFVAEYLLCAKCLKRVSQMRGIESWHRPQPGDKKPEMVTVLAKTWSTLKNIFDQEKANGTD